MQRTSDTRLMITMHLSQREDIYEE